MADTSWEYIIPGCGIYNDTSQDFEPVVPGCGIINEGVITGGRDVLRSPKNNFFNNLITR